MCGSSLAGFFSAQAMRHELQRHVLEGRGRPVPELVKESVVKPARARRGRILAVGCTAVVKQFLKRVVGEKFCKYVSRPLVVGHMAEFVYFILGKGRYASGDTARRRQYPLNNPAEVYPPLGSLVLL